MNPINNLRSASQHLRNGVLRCIRVMLVLLVVACAGLLGVVAAGSVTGAWRLLPVRTGSMTPHAPQGSVVIMHPMPASQIRTGQIIVFHAPVPGHPVVVHRIYQLTPARGGPIIRTKGDANPVPDPWRFRIRGRTVWRGGMVIPELGNAMFLLETPHARVVALATVVALLTAMGLAAIWASGLLAPIVWRAPEIQLAPIAWRAEPLRGWRGRRREWRQARLGRRDARRAQRPALAPVKAPHRTERLAALVAALAVGVAATVGSGAFALFTGNAAATATYSTSKLAAPTSLSATESGSGATATVTLNWTATTSGWATGTRVFRGTTSGGPYSQITQIAGLATTTYVNTPGAGTFYYVVEAYYSANGANWTSVNSNQVSAFVPYTDTTVFQDGLGTQTTAAFSTAGPDDRLLAFVGSDGPTTGGQAVTVSGAGLSWSLVRRTNTQLGDAEVWTALASSPLTNATVKSTPSISGYNQSLTVVALTGTTGIGTSAAANASTGAPSVSLTTTAKNSLVYAVGNDWDQAIARTVGPGQTMVHQHLFTNSGDTMWVQSQTALVPNAGTVSTINDTAPTGDRWNYTAIEVKTS